MKPIRPEEVQDNMPCKVIEVFNKIIRDSYRGSKAIVPLHQAVREISRALRISESCVVESKLLDVEEIYRREGWEVEYHQPARDQDFAPYFKFSKPGGKHAAP